MPAVIPFIPMIAQGVGAYVGGKVAKKAQKSAMERTPEEMAALTGAQGVAGSAGKTSQQLLQSGQNYLQQPASYYQTLLSGNRAAMANAVAAPAAALREGARGQQRGLERSGIRGAARDVAGGEISRQLGGQLGGLTTGVQPYAAQQLAGLGGTALQAGGGLAGTAGNIYGNLLTGGFENRKYGRQEGQNAGKAIGGLISDIGKLPWGNIGGGGDMTEPPLGNLDVWKRGQTSYPR